MNSKLKQTLHTIVGVLLLGSAATGAIACKYGKTPSGDHCNMFPEAVQTPDAANS